MKFGQVLGAAVLVVAASAKSVDSFLKGGNIDQSKIISGPSKVQRDVPNIVERAASATSLTSDSSCTNGPLTRNCWSKGYSVATDFDQKWPTTGVTRYYTLTISNTTCNPDGNGKKQCMLVNNQFPGPTIRANWGDMISVTVNNNLKNNGTGIHWHGFRQLNTNPMDGVVGITECPIAPGTSSVYTFHATQFGTSWYHSHFAAQYGDGVLGPIIIDGPTSTNWDIDMGPLSIQDWYYQTATQVDYLTLAGLQQGGPGPGGSNILINGTNKNVAGTTGSYLKAKLTTGKKHLFRIINTSVDNTLRVSLDGHNITLITADFVPIQPLTVESVLINVGQRYEIIVNANQTPGNYWLRVEAEGLGCYSSNDGVGKAIFTYSTVKQATPSTSSTYTNGATALGSCNEPGPLTPWVPNQVGDQASFIQQATNLDVSLLIPGVNTNTESVVVWGINSSALQIQWDRPVLQYVMEGNNSFPVSENLIELATEGEWVFWIIQEVQPNAPPPHPIHLHGHDFYVLGRGSGTFDITSDPAKLQYTNPTRRDVATLPGGGWLVIAFTTDNPGAWLMHCHIAWHISEGLGVQFLEAAPSITLPGAAWQSQCASWSTYQKTMKYPKLGSGL